MAQLACLCYKPKSLKVVSVNKKGGGGLWTKKSNTKSKTKNIFVFFNIFTVTPKEIPVETVGTVFSESCFFFFSNRKKLKKRKENSPGSFNPRMLQLHGSGSQSIFLFQLFNWRF